MSEGNQRRLAAIVSADVVGYSRLMGADETGTLAGATLGKDASTFAGTAGGPPRTGQFFIAISPDHFSGGEFGARMSELTQAIGDQTGARLPSSRCRSNRAESDRDGIVVEESLLARIDAFATQPGQ